MKSMTKSNEAGVDEVGRGCLLGPVAAAAVILPDTIFEIEGYTIINDSKSVTKTKRKIAFEFIKKHAVAYSVAFSDAEYIDKHNILNATIATMHAALDGLCVAPSNILVDGTQFKQFGSISHECVVQGDTKFMNIAAASIIAKVTRDNYIAELCDKTPHLDEKYALRKNMGYGTKAHIDGIRRFGICDLHRKTFAPCKHLLNNQITVLF
tara:strand:+ start:3166 stop:3792 length:627 start_codon:yes stop_codon:yes gene_type:complete